jgi:hypothetical protein
MRPKNKNIRPKKYKAGKYSKKSRKTSTWTFGLAPETKQEHQLFDVIIKIANHFREKIQKTKENRRRKLFQVMNEIKTNTIEKAGKTYGGGSLKEKLKKKKKKMEIKNVGPTKPDTSKEQFLKQYQEQKGKLDKNAPDYRKQKKDLKKKF